jgi:ABC-2 type transport system ATP-binding protein
MQSQIKLKIDGLTKFYGSIRGIEDLNLEIMNGEIFGFLGPNGAGKTTTLRCVMGILLPSKGYITLDGEVHSRSNPELRKKMGYIPEGINLPENYIAQDFLDYIESMRGIASPLRDDLIDRFNLPIKRRIKELSRGNKQKVAVIAGMMHDPEILLLDEPTSGLDPLFQQEVHNLLLDARERNKTVFFSSHNLDEVQRISDRVGIVKEGQLVNILDVESLNKEVARVLEVTLLQPDQERLSTLADNMIEFKDNKIKLLVKKEDSIRNFLNILLPMDPIELSYPPASLETYFLQFYGS